MNLADRVRGVLKPPTAAEPERFRPPLEAKKASKRPPGASGARSAGGRHFVVERRIDAGERHGRTSVGDFAAALDANAAYTVAPDVRRAGPGAVRVPRPRNHRAQRRRGHLCLPRRLRMVFERRFVYHATAPDGVARRRARDAASGRRRVRAGRRAGQLQRQVFRRAGARNPLSVSSPGVAGRNPARTSTCCIRRGDFWGDGRRAVRWSCSKRRCSGARRIAMCRDSRFRHGTFNSCGTGDARPLGVVLEHNRLDLLSLAGPDQRVLLELVRPGRSRPRARQEAVALGRIYARAGLSARARRIRARASSWRRPRWSTSCASAAPARARAQRRHARRYENAAVLLAALVDTPAARRSCARAAAEALAIHHEHRVRDLPAARAFALESLDSRRSGMARRRAAPPGPDRSENGGASSAGGPGSTRRFRLLLDAAPGD